MFETPIFYILILNATDNFVARDWYNFAVKDLKYNFVGYLNIIFQLEV